ncbi:hypothetical protein [Streptomyces sp. MBT62]|uniref:hypothetical protein n=1 Tax=Streptomyces sp. MBT62 TaxID=2800410 RepID=UPI00190957D4|nr:hypothetical protein [Streptomyces sp. MBT62]MBK3564499.1 hypothetical protein [Streptomyces sp. MBT62]
MPSSNNPSPPPPATPHDPAVQGVLTCFDTYARIRAARDSVLSASRVGQREEERAFGDLQQAISRLRSLSRPR